MNNVITAPLEAADVEALTSEANEHRRLARSTTVGAFRIDGDGSLRGPRQVGVATGGATLNRLQREYGMSIALEAYSSSAGQLFPTRACYLYYAPGDYALLHHDVSHCGVTLLACLSDNAEPLLLYPDFGRATVEDALTLNSARATDRAEFDRRVSGRIDATRMRSVEIRLEPGAIVAQRGRDVPHARYAQAQMVTVAAVCYAPMTHTPAWAGRR
jgi:hypothetical protein